MSPQNLSQRAFISSNPSWTSWVRCCSSSCSCCSNFYSNRRALPAGISVVVSKAQLKEKESLYKGCHRTFKQLLREVRMNKMRPDVDEREIIRETFSKVLQLEKEANYVVPFEIYMKSYKLNGYNSKK